MNESPTNVINVVGDNTSISINSSRTDKPLRNSLSGSISNCYSTDFGYHPRIELDQKLQNIQKGHAQILHGPLGTGKKSAALQFVETSKERFFIRWSVDCSETEETIQSNLETELAKNLGFQEKVSISKLFEVIKEKGAENDVIFFLVNVEKKPQGNWLKELWRIKDCLYIMMTSCNDNLDVHFPGAEMVLVGKFKEALDFLEENTSIKEGNSREDLKELCDYFGWNALGIVASKRYITSTKITAKKYLKMMKNKTAALNVRQKEMQDMGTKPLYVAVRVCLENIDREQFSVVAAIALIAHENIPTFLLAELFPSENAEVRDSKLNNLVTDSFFLRLLMPMTKENNVRLLSCEAFTQTVIRDLLNEDQELRGTLINKIAGILVKYFNKDNRFKQDAFIQQIMVNHAKVFLHYCQRHQDDCVMIALARLWELIAFTSTQIRGPRSEETKEHFERSESILHQLCGIKPEDFRGTDDIVAERLFKKLTEKSSQLPITTIQELVFRRPVSAADMSFFPDVIKKDDDFQEKVHSKESLSENDIENLVINGAAYSVCDYCPLYLPELYASLLYSFGRHYFYLKKEIIQNASTYVTRMKLAYRIACKISERMKPGEAVIHQYLTQCNALLYLLVNDERVCDDGRVRPKETFKHCQDLELAIKQYQMLSETKETYFEMGILKKKGDACKYSQVVCQHQILRCYLKLTSHEMTPSREEREVYVKEGARHCEVLLRILTEGAINKEITLSSKYYNAIGEFYLAAGDNYLLPAWRIFSTSAKKAEEEKKLPARFYVQAVVGLADVLSRLGTRCSFAAKLSTRQLNHSYSYMNTYHHVHDQLPSIGKQILEIKERNNRGIVKYYAELWRRGGNVKPVQETDPSDSKTPGSDKPVQEVVDSTSKTKDDKPVQEVDDENAGENKLLQAVVDSDLQTEGDDKPLQAVVENNSQTEDKRSSLMELAGDIPRHWKPVARELGCSEGKIDEIEINYRGEVVEQAYQILWYSWNFRDPTSWSEDLGKALCKVGRNDLAKKYTNYTRLAQ